MSAAHFHRAYAAPTWPAEWYSTFSAETMNSMHENGMRQIGKYIVAAPIDSETAEFFGLTSTVVRAVVDDFGNLRRVEA